MQEEHKHAVARVPRLSAGLGALAALALTFALAFPRAFEPVAAPVVPVAQAPVAAAVKEDALERFRVERAQVREAEMAQLNALIGDEGADAGLRDEARRQLLALTGYMEQEVTLEGVLRARGFEDVVATVHVGSVNVLVRASALTRAQSATILELALRETGQQSGNIKVIPVGEGQ